MATSSSSSNSNIRGNKKAMAGKGAGGSGSSKLPPPGEYRGTSKPRSSRKPTPPPSQQQKAQPTPAPTATRRPIRPAALVLPSLAIFAFTTYGTYLYTTYTRAVHESSTLHIPADVSDRYDKSYSTYDSEVDTAEWLMNLPKRRRELVQKARGHVLEVSCGTGRNLEFYEVGERRGVSEVDGKGVVKGVKSLTLVDRSEGMVEVARRKFEEMYPKETSGKERGLVRFLAQDAMADISPPPTAQTASTSTTKNQQQENSPYKFDTILQTMGLCSHPDPVSLLKHLSTITEPDRGQILLLEHGRSHYEWLNRILDGLAAAHADRHGCWWNRDIGDVVERSGLVVVERKRWHLGTTWGFVLRPAEAGEGGHADENGEKKGK